MVSPAIVAFYVIHATKGVLSNEKVFILAKCTEPNQNLVKTLVKSARA